MQHQHEVLGVSRSPEPHVVFLPYRGLPTADKFRFPQIDLNSQIDELIVFTKEFRPEYVVNSAAQDMVAQSWGVPEHWYQTNVVGQVRLHDQLRKLPFLKKYVYVRPCTVQAVLLVR